VAAVPDTTADTTGLQRAPMWLLHLGFAVLVLGSWELYGRTGNDLILPPLSDVLAGVGRLISTGELQTALAGSLRLLFIGFGLALVTGFVFGVVAGRYRTADRTLRPFLDALYATPVIALVPLVLVWFGFGLSGRVTIVFLASFFPILINVYAGVRDAPQHLIDVARAFGVTGELGLLRRVIVPAAVPFIMAGVRLGIGRGVVGMAVAEVYLRLGGIGALIVEYGNVFRTDLLLAAILPLPLIGIGLTKLFAVIERHFQEWKTV
jgi:ABC-type nitrate/sulfonate/bicarbonate transport system permease component